MQNLLPSCIVKKAPFVSATLKKQAPFEENSCHIGRRKLDFAGLAALGEGVLGRRRTSVTPTACCRRHEFTPVKGGVTLFRRKQGSVEPRRAVTGLAKELNAKCTAKLGCEP